MKDFKWIFWAIAAVLALAAAITAIMIFRNEIVDLCVDVKDKLQEKKSALFTHEEYADYADV